MSTGNSTVDPWVTPPGRVAGEQRDISALYELIHDVLSAEEARQAAAAKTDELIEQRGATRRSFGCRQLLAPFDGERLPSQTEFHPELCHDLSPSGFAYWSATVPTCRQFVVALGCVPFLFFAAQLVRSEWHPERREWLLGCRFIRRIG